MIERWFPCAEVSEASESGWGSGKSEKALFIWFAARPLAQAKAAVITSLLPWPDDPREQERLKDIVRRAMTDRDAAHDELIAELAKAYPSGASMLDPFSGRAMIPLEAARLGVKAWAIDYSPVATLAGTLLADYPLRDWSGEAPLPFGQPLGFAEDRLTGDVARVLAEIGRRYEDSMAEFYPRANGKRPWGYLWAVTLPCQECGRRFPVTGSLVLRHPLAARKDPGQSYRIEADRGSGSFRAVVHEGAPVGQPTLVTVNRGGKAQRGKAAVCPFCEHVHLKDVHTRLAGEGLGRDALLVAADLDEAFGKVFREPTREESAAAEEAPSALKLESSFGPGLPAVPDETIPDGDFDTVRPSLYGARDYGDLCNARQTLGFVRLSRIVEGLGRELCAHGTSPEYAACLAGYAASVVVRKLKYSTRGARLRPYAPTASRNQNWVQVEHVFPNESSIAFNYDYFETGLADGPGGWTSVADDTLRVLYQQAQRQRGRPAAVSQGTAVSLPNPSASIDAVVTDPPYDDMIDYSDASDLFYVWLKRALVSTHPELGLTADPRGVQEKSEEIIVKRGGAAVGDHRTRDFYDMMLARSFGEARRVVRDHGVVTIVFGHGDPEVWHRLLKAIMAGGLYLTGSWPAKTESGGKAGSANIVTTLTLSCRPAPASRPTGRVDDVDDEVRREVRARVPEWERANLALTDQLMASAGPAMEVVGHYSAVLDQLGEPIDTTRYLVLARRAVEEAAAIKIEDLPLETFDARSRFALFWVRLYGRGLAPKSEARWQAMVSDIALPEISDILRDGDGGRGVRIAFGQEVSAAIEETSSVVDVVLAMARAWPDGLAAVAEVLASSGRDSEDPHLWAAVGFLSARLPEADPDVQAWNGIVRGRRTVASATLGVVKERSTQAARRKQADDQMQLFDPVDGGGQG
jgi:adenine-specific DNA methylase